MIHALINCWKAIQNDIYWNPDEEEIPAYVTLRFLVNLVVNERQKAPLNSKLIMTELRGLKITTFEVLWTSLLKAI